MAYSSIIYKADQRLEKETESYVYYNTTTSEPDHHEPVFGHLISIEDVFLKPGKDIEFDYPIKTGQVIIPVIGEFSFGIGLAEQVVAPDEILNTSPYNAFTIKNNYQEQTINFLKINTLLPLLCEEHEAATVVPFVLEEYNVLKPFSIGENTHACIGVFNGRTKGNYTLKNKENAVFAYIMNGAFELEDRLLEYRDGLAVWNKEDTEFEALSEFAVLLLIETPLSVIINNPLKTN